MARPHAAARARRYKNETMRGPFRSGLRREAKIFRARERAQQIQGRAQPPLHCRRRDVQCPRDLHNRNAGAVDRDDKRATERIELVEQGYERKLDGDAHILGVSRMLGGQGHDLE